MLAFESYQVLEGDAYPRTVKITAKRILDVVELEGTWLLVVLLNCKTDEPGDESLYSGRM